jgi:CheY-like chemotaxis protein
LRHLRQTEYDLTVCDWKMPGLNGRQVYDWRTGMIDQRSENFIFITGDIINEKTQQFLRDSKSVGMSKPFSVDEFRSAISKILRKA